MQNEQQIDVLAIGEALIDFIADATLDAAIASHHFHLYPGGQVTNVALNVARLGGSSALVARVGDDSFGTFLRSRLASGGVEVSFCSPTLHMSTTLVVVIGHDGTPDFTVYRGADAHLVPADMPYSLLNSTTLVHTSAFALSREPSRSTIREFIQLAHTAGCLVSFDPNYHPRLWEMDVSPLAIFADICPFVSLVKPSLDDCTRLFGANQSPEAYATRFLAWGVQEVVLTMGATGVLYATPEKIAYYAADKIDVVDVTGAGDSFWAGLLLARRDGFSTADAIRVAQAVAAIKLRQAGPLTQNIDRHALYRQLHLKREEGNDC